MLSKRRIATMLSALAIIVGGEVSFIGINHANANRIVYSRVI